MVNKDDKVTMISFDGEWGIAPPFPVTRATVLALKEAGLLEVTENPDGSLTCKALPALFEAVDSNFGEGEEERP